MLNLFDYLEWRGDLSFARDSFNEVDNLIMSVLAYVKFEEIVPLETGVGTIPLLKAAERLRETMEEPSSFYSIPFFNQIPKLLFKAAESKRFRDIKLSGYVNQIDYEQSKQFSAVVFSINSKLHFIAFRGTDDSLAGWKEDFQMSFMEEVQAQNQAVIYLERILSNLAGDFYLGGHSKGGNLAVYAASHEPKNIQDRIIGIYNNEGPGFQTNIIQSEGYQSILGKISTLIPKSSVVGMLLEHGEEYRVVSSSETGIVQHNPFSWEVKGRNFVYEKGLTKDSLNINKVLRAWLNQLSMEERAQFVDALFDIIQATGAKTIGELSKEKLALANSMIKTYKNMDTLTQSHLKNSVEIFFKESQKVIKNSINEDINSLFSKKRFRLK